MARLCSISGCGRRHQARGFCAMHYMRLWQTGTTDVGAFEKGGHLRWLTEVAAKYQGEDCLPCRFYDGREYPRVHVKGQRVFAHRIICEIANGPPPTPLHQAAHGCGNRACVNPRHLRWATAKENHADKFLHGTIARGARNGNAKLDETQVRAIKAMLAGGAKLKEIAQRFDVSLTNVSDIKRGRVWSWV